jgi:hypothetical protein
MIRNGLVVVVVPVSLLVRVASAFGDTQVPTATPLAASDVAAPAPSAEKHGPLSNTYLVTFTPALAPPQPTGPPALTVAPPAEPIAEEHHGPSSNRFPSHDFQWAPHSAKGQVDINFGLLQLVLGGLNVAIELRYRRLWLEYSHGMDLTLNNVPGLTMTQTERSENLHIFMPYTTGFGVGLTILDELWFGFEFKTHRYEVNAPGGPVAYYQTFSMGPVLGYKFFIFRGLYLNAYFRYWPNVASSLDNGQVALTGTNGTVMHSAHDFNVFGNFALGYAFDL